MDEPHSVDRIEHKLERTWFAFCKCGKAFSGTEEDQAAARLNDHIAGSDATHPRSPCPTPEKQSYRSEHEALHALVEVWRIGRGQTKTARHAYHCPCGRWHLRSK